MEMLSIKQEPAIKEEPEDTEMEENSENITRRCTPGNISGITEHRDIRTNRRQNRELSPYRDSVISGDESVSSCLMGGSEVRVKEEEADDTASQETESVHSVKLPIKGEPQDDYILKEKCPNGRCLESAGTAEKRPQTDDGFSSDDDVPLKKICSVSDVASPPPAVIATPVPTPTPDTQPLSPLPTLTSPTATVPVQPAHPLPPLLPEAAPKSALPSPTRAVTDVQLAPSAPPILEDLHQQPPRSPTLPPPFNPTFTQAIHQPTPPSSMTSTGTESTFPRTLNFPDSTSFLKLSNSGDSEKRQILQNQQMLFSAITALTDKVNTLEQTMCRLTQALTKTHAKHPGAVKSSRPVYIDNEDGTVQVGDEKRAITLKKREVESCFNHSKSGKEYVLKLMSLAYTNKELAGSNYPGGRTICGVDVKHKNALKDQNKFKAILASAESNFPGCTIGVAFKTLKDAVNNKCRKLDRKLMMVSS